jgi:hypothetical protein
MCLIDTPLMPDAVDRQNYKRKPIAIYNPHKAPLLDHYRYVSRLELTSRRKPLTVDTNRSPQAQGSSSPSVLGVHQLHHPVYSVRYGAGR